MVDVPPVAIWLGPKNLVMLTRPTPRLAVLDTGPVVPVVVVLRPEVVLLYVPAIAERTAKVNVHVPPAATLPEVTWNVVAPALSVLGAKTPQPVPVTVPPVATRFAGKASVSAGLLNVSGTVFGLLMTIESVLSVFGATAVGAKALAIVGFVKSCALAAAALATPVPLVSAPAAMVLV